MKKTPVTHFTRRRFLATAAGAAIAPTIIPGSALGLGKRPAPSERITLGAIGFGTIAHETVRGFLEDERVQIVGVADPAKDFPNYGYGGEKRGGRDVGASVVNEKYGNKDCKTFIDFREMMDKLDLDAVNVSTPDHWHSYAAIYSARKGKHIYGQKPLAVTIGQGRAMVEAVAKAGVTWQTGSQQRSDQYFRMAAEFVRNGRLGKLQGITVGLPGGHTDWNQHAAQKDAAPVPEGLDYDLWEGPAPARPYCPALLPLNWRHNYDYSGGMITDWGAHHIDIVQWALGMDESGPVRMENIRGTVPAPGDLFNTATSFHFECVYADGTRLTVGDIDDVKTGTGITFKGEDGKSLYVERGKIQFDPRTLGRERIKDDEIRLYESKDHYRNFIDCIYSGKATAAPIEAAHRTITVAHLANIGLRTGKGSFDWDPKTELSGDGKVDSMINITPREGFAI